MPAPPLEFLNVSKIYHLASQDLRPNHFFGRLRHAVLPYRKEFFALRDVSFSVQRHETLGLIGHNGAGKSTILKLLSRITAPSRGKIVRRGRIAGLIEVGSGFHPELSGRDNIFLSGSILGMRRAEIRSKLDSIVEFAGIEAFLDTPVKQYSSGMAVRLGFSVAAHLDSDVLLLDEVLAVGDSSFQLKCVERIQSMKRQGRTMIFISHDLSAVEKLCDRLLLLKNGQISAEGDVSHVLTQYQRQRGEMNGSRTERFANAGVSIRSFALFNGSGHETLSFEPGLPLSADLTVDASLPIEDLRAEVFFFRPDYSLPCQLYSRAAAAEAISLQPGQYRLRFHCPALILAPGVYHLCITLSNGTTGKQLDLLDQISIHVDTPAGLEGMRGSAFLPQSLQIEAVRSGTNER